jgi:hypothetical protein
MQRHAQARPTLIECLFGAVGLGLVFRYRWLLDDSFIYYRYVDNFLFLHRGLVFNRGEFVEGYSSPLWLLVLVALRAVRMDYWSITLAIGVIAYTLVWYAAVVVNRRLEGQGAGPSINLPLIYLSTSYAVTSYFTSGSEAPLVQLSAAGIALYALDPESKWLQLALGALPLVRNELAVPLLAVFAVGWHATKRVPWRLFATSAGLGLGWLAFRVYYYADFFPTPFYLKDKVSIAQGFYYVWNAIGPEHFIPFFAITSLALILLWKRHDEHLMLRERARMGIVAASALPYVIKVGGDMMHHRLLGMPICLLSLATGGLVERWLAATGLARSGGSRFAIGAACGVALFLAYPWFLSAHPVWRKEGRVLDHGISDAPWHRQHALMTFEPARRSEDSARLEAYRLASAEHTGIASDVLCAAMFNDFRRRYVHGYGLTEPILARVDVPEQRPGHKEDLVALAKDLVSLRSRYPDTEAEIVDQAIGGGGAPEWIVANRAKIRLIDDRMYNSHRFFENLTAALSHIGPIELPVR